MKKQILSIGKVLSRAEQKEVSGGRGKCISNCAGQPHGTACYAPDCTCPGICSGNQCAMF